MVSCKNITYYGGFGYSFHWSSIFSVYFGGIMSHTAIVNLPTATLPLATLPTLDSQTRWQLYGTMGCHLCDIAEDLLRQAQAVADFEFVTVDIAELSEAQALQWADKIPVLITPTKTLYYPFSVLDIVAAAQSV